MVKEKTKIRKQTNKQTKNTHTHTKKTQTKQKKTIGKREGNQLPCGQNGKISEHNKSNAKIGLKIQIWKMMIQN